MERKGIPAIPRSSCWLAGHALRPRASGEGGRTTGKRGRRRSGWPTFSPLLFSPARQKFFPPSGSEDPLMDRRLWRRRVASSFPYPGPPTSSSPGDRTADMAATYGLPKDGKFLSGRSYSFAGLRTSPGPELYLSSP